MREAQHVDADMPDRGHAAYICACASTAQADLYAPAFDPRYAWPYAAQMVTSVGQSEVRALLKATGWKQGELAGRTGVSQATVSRWLKGSIPEIPQQIALQKLLADADLAPGTASARTEIVESRRGHSVITHVPLIDEVTAGRLAKPSSQLPVEDVPLLAFADLGPGEFFALTVKGTSMDRISPEGSIIVVNRRDKTLISSKPYVFTLRGETTYKRWQRGQPEYLEPYSTDPIHKPIFPGGKRSFEVIGRVKRTVLDL